MIKSKLTKKAAAETAIAELKTALEGDDKAEIEAKTEVLTAAAGKIAEKAYAEQAGAEQADSSDGDGADDVVDAEFEEVNEGKDDK